MRAVAIDASTPKAGVALWQDGSVVAARYTEEPDFHAERLLGLLDGALADSGWSRGSIDLLVSGIGPGSFTGIRVGLATAKGLALALDRPIVGVGSLETMAAAAFRDPAVSTSADVVLALLDARKGEVFAAAYDSSGAVVHPPAHLPGGQVQAFAERLGQRRLIAVGQIASRLDLGAVRQHTSSASDAPDVGVMAHIGHARVAAQGADDLCSLEPMYVRPPDITVPKS
jgi:tRNA threonylcarbamoyladenosine biosynthesis protein TsaB